MLKITGYIAGGLLLLVLIGGIGWKIIGKTEGYRADEQNFYSFEPHFLLPGCANYNVIRDNMATKKKEESKLKPVKIERVIKK